MTLLTKSDNNQTERYCEVSKFLEYLKLNIN